MNRSTTSQRVVCSSSRFVVEKATEITRSDRESTWEELADSASAAIERWVSVDEVVDDESFRP